MPCGFKSSERLKQPQKLTTEHGPSVQSWGIVVSLCETICSPARNAALKMRAFQALSLPDKTFLQTLNSHMNLFFFFLRALLGCTVHFAENILCPSFMPGWISKETKRLMCTLTVNHVWDPFGFYIRSINKQWFLSFTCCWCLVCMYDDYVCKELNWSDANIIYLTLLILFLNLFS